MKVFVTGATGFIGIQLVKRLVEEGNTIHALYRSESKADLLRLPNVILFKGDLLDLESIKRAMKGCSVAYHTAAFASVWSKDPNSFFRLNVDGAMNVINEAGKCGIKRVVVTSTAGILGPSENEAVHEYSPVPTSFFTPYEASKYKMEQSLKAYSNSQPEIIIVNPTRVYGPGFLSKSNGVTEMIKQYISGKWKLMPGDGNRSGNYVYVEDVVTGHLLAMERGISGERYVLGGENITYHQLFQFTREASGVYKRLYQIPVWAMLLTSYAMMGISKIINKPPLIVPGWVRKLTHNWIVSSERAARELDYNPVSASEGIQRTVDWIKSNNP